MPVFDIDTTPQRFVLPSTESKPADQQFWVMMRVNPVSSLDYDGSMTFIDDGNKVTRWIVAHRISGWNATDPNGQPIDTTIENIDVILNSQDMYWLYRQIKKPAEGTILEDTEKKS